MLPIFPGQDHRHARDTLVTQGWKWLANGDWSHVYASPDGLHVARVVPFDPAYALHVRTCRAHPEIAHFPRIDWSCPLAPAGDVTVLERLEPADPASASRLCCLLGETRHLDGEPDDAEIARWEQERVASAKLVALASVLEEALSTGRRSLGWFGGLDVRPGNIMQDARGQLKIFDPYFVAGPKLIEAMLADIEDVAKHYAHSELRGFLEIAVFDAEQDAPGPVLAQLRERVARLADAGTGCDRTPNTVKERKEETQ